MLKPVDLTGQRFGRLVVLERAANDKWGHHKWLCRCNCEDRNEVIVAGNSLKSRRTRSCGCLLKEWATRRFTTHGHAKRGKTTRTYLSWVGMIQRCRNPNDKYYKDYGGRGITVCKRWEKFPNFLEDMGESPHRYQIDRENNNKGYSKENCRWVTSKINNRNKRNSRLITYEGKTKPVVQWAEEYNIPYQALYQRIYKRGWSIRRALTVPIRKIQRRK